MFHFDPPENIKEIEGFLVFSGGSKGNIGRKKVKQITPLMKLTLSWWGGGGRLFTKNAFTRVRHRGELS